MPLVYLDPVRGVSWAMEVDAQPVWPLGVTVYQRKRQRIPS
jgi:hypothetical protein